VLGSKVRAFRESKPVLPASLVKEIVTEKWLFQEK